MNEIQLRGKASEVVERANVVQQIVGEIESKKVDPFGSKQDAIYAKLSEASAFTLADGKSSYELGEDQYNYLFSNNLDEQSPMRARLASSDPTGSFVGNNTYGSLNMFIAEVGSSMNKDFTLTPWYPDTPVETMQVQVDRRSPIAGLLPEHDYGEDLPAIRNIDTYGYQYEGVRWAGNSRIGPRDMIYLREKGNASFATRGIQQKIAYEGLSTLIKAFTTRNYILSQAVMENGFSWRGLDIASGIPAGNVFTFSQPLGTYSLSTGSATPNPNCNPIQEFSNLLAGWVEFLPYQQLLRQIVLNQRDYTAITQNPNFQALFGNRTIDGRLKKFEGVQKEVFTFGVPQLGNVEFMVESEQWMNVDAQGIADRSTSQYFIPSGKAFMGLDLSQYGGRLGAFHLTPALENGGYANPQSGIGVQVYDRTTIDVGKPEIWVVPFLNGGPAVYMPEATFIVDFNYVIVP